MINGREAEAEAEVAYLQPQGNLFKVCWNCILQTWELQHLKEREKNFLRRQAVGFGEWGGRLDGKAKTWGLAVLEWLLLVKWEKFIWSEILLNESLGVGIEVRDYLPSEAGHSLSPVQVVYLLFKCALFLSITEPCFTLANAVTSFWCYFCMWAKSFYFSLWLAY